MHLCYERRSALLIRMEKIQLGQHLCNICVYNPSQVGIFLKFHSDKTLFTKLLFQKLLNYFSIFPEHSGCLLARTEECLLMSVPAKLHFFAELGKCLEKDIYKVVGHNKRIPGKKGAASSEKSGLDLRWIVSATIGQASCILQTLSKLQAKPHICLWGTILPRGGISDQMQKVHFSGGNVPF